MNPIRGEQHREPFLGSVLVDQKIVETDIEGAFVDREMTQGRREERGVTKGDHIQWRYGGGSPGRKRPIDDAPERVPSREGTGNT